MPTPARTRTLRGPWCTDVYPARGALTTALAGTNNDLTFTSTVADSAGNSVRVRYVVAGVSTPLSVSVAGNDITVNVATNGASAATSTAAQVRDAVNASAAASALVAAANAAGNDGTGVVAALAFTNLTGGVTRTFGRGGAWRR